MGGLISRDKYVPFPAVFVPFVGAWLRRIDLPMHVIYYQQC